MKPDMKYIPLRGPQKAAAFMLSLEESTVAKILSFLEQDEIQHLSKAMANLGLVEAKTMENIYEEFRKDISQGTGTVVGSIEKTEKLLLQIFPPEKVEEIMADIVGPVGKNLWEKIENVDNDYLVSFLQTEHPQTIAVVLTRFHPIKAAAILKMLPIETAKDVVLRIIKLDMVSKEVLSDLEMSLRNQFMSNVSKTHRRDSHQIAADIFNLFDRDSESTFLRFLEESSPDDADRVKELMFTFEDMIRLDGQGIQEVIRIADKTKLSLALKGSSQQVRDLFINNMSERAGKLLLEEIEALGRVRLKEVDDAQASIVTQAKGLIDQGTISIAVMSEQEEKYIE